MLVRHISSETIRRRNFSKDGSLKMMGHILSLGLTTYTRNGSGCKTLAISLSLHIKRQSRHSTDK